jgi:hypothetical protein
VILVFVGGFAVFWNGILAMSLLMLVFARDGGPFNWLMALFLVPFVLVGVALAGYAIKHGLQLTNPRPTIAVTSAIVALGEPLRLEWTMTGRVSRLARLTITLEGREEASYTRGTDTVTDRHVFAVIPIAEQAAPRIEARGSARVTIPRGTMHSFEARHNKIVWLIRIRGEVPRWPDSDDEFPLLMAPQRAGAEVS